jgi:transcriptional regulator with XRE-family HTH domain
MRGYSIRVAEAIKEANGDLLGVKLGRACLARDISVSAVATDLGVTRQTVYHWFLGLSEPRGGARDAIQTYLASLD